MVIKINYTSSDVYVSTSVSPVYVVVNYSAVNNGGGAIWGGITGTLSDQTDLQDALDDKFDDPTGTTSQYLRGDGSLATFPSLTGFVPYTGATANVDLGTHRILAQNATIASSGSGDTFTLNHSSGSGIGLNITKGGSGEGLYINKTSGSGNAATIIGTLNATTLVKSGGTSSQFLKADGSVDSTTYVGGSGVSGQVAYWNGTNSQTGSNNLFWNNANANLGIGSNAVNSVWKLGVDGNIALTGFLSLGAITGSGSNAFFEVSSTQLRIYAHTSRYLSFSANATEFARLLTTGNFILGSTFTDGGQRLQVQGDAFIKGSGSGDTTNSLLIQNSSSSQIFNVRNDGVTFINNFLQLSGGINSSTIFGNQTIRLLSGGTTEPRNYIWLTNTVNFTSVTNNINHVIIGAGFAPTSGTAQYTQTTINPTINQTGGANGITRGLYVNPTLTAAADWRSIEWSNNSGWGLYGAGTAPNFLGGNLSVSRNQNGGTIITVSNTTSGNNSQSGLVITSDSLSGNGYFAKYSSAKTAYKIVNASDFYLINDTAGDISILNDWSSGKIKFSGGASSTAQMTLTAAGRLLLGTTTESTFLLDVNGTARFIGQVTLGTGAYSDKVIQLGFASTNANTSAFSNSTTFPRFGQNNSINRIFYDNGTYNPTSGTGTYSAFETIVTVNQTGGANGITRGLFINPTLTAAADWRAIEVSAGGAYINTTSVQASAILQADSTTKGFLPPRMTNAQRTAISSPAVGLIVYCTDLVEGLYVYKSTGWTFVI
jgi:hypothetical protein